MSEQITLYTAKICPFAHRVEIALNEAGAEFSRYEIDLKNKPEWYGPKVNSLGKVPSIAYGGPQVPADQPSPESVKLNESAILVEFIADLFPDAGLLPKDPSQRAKARLFIDTFSNKYIPAMLSLFMGGNVDKVEDLVKALEDLQKLLPSEGFVVGEWSIADITIAPFLARVEIMLRNDLGAYPAGSNIGPQILERIGQPTFARLQKYQKDVLARPSVISTFDGNYILEMYTKNMGELRAQKYGV